MSVFGRLRRVADLLDDSNQVRLFRAIWEVRNGTSAQVVANVGYLIAKDGGFLRRAVCLLTYISNYKLPVRPRPTCVIACFSPTDRTGHRPNAGFVRTEAEH